MKEVQLIDIRVLAAILGFLILLGIYYGNVYVSQEKGFHQVFFQGTGATVISISKAYFTSRDPFFNEETWVVTLVPEGMAQRLHGEITPDDLEAASGVRSAKKFTIDITFHKQVAEYPIKVDYSSIPIYKLDYEEWWCWGPPSDEDAKQHCGDEWIYKGVYGGDVVPPFNCFCIAREPQSSYIGVLQPPSIHWTVTFKVCVDGECKEETFDSKNKISGFIGDIAYVTWDFSGIRNSGLLPSYHDYRAVYRLGNWYTTDASAYDSYYTTYTQFESWANAHLKYIDISERNTLKSKVAEVNGAADRALEGKYFGTIVNRAKVKGAYVEYPLPSAVEVPVFTLYIKADKLGIYQPVPEIEIVDYSKEVEFSTGETGYAWVMVKNKGNERGSVDAWIECEYPIYMKGATVTETIDPGVTKKIYLPLISGAEREIMKYCTIYVKERVTEKVYTAKVKVTVHPQKICEPGHMRCSYDRKAIEICNEAGTGYVVYKYCGSDERCEYVDGTPKCVKIETISPPVAPEEEVTFAPECKNYKEWLGGRLFGWLPGVTPCRPAKIPIKLFGFTIGEVSQDIIYGIPTVIAVIILIWLYLQIRSGRTMAEIAKSVKMPFVRRG